MQTPRGAVCTDGTVAGAGVGSDCVEGVGNAVGVNVAGGAAGAHGAERACCCTCCCRAVVGL
eukprot:4580978-Alexandrium_andersonii.AAC.1